MSVSIRKMEKEIVGEIWTSNDSYENLASLCDFGSRASGTESQKKAKDFILRRFKEYALENSHLEPFEYLGWIRGEAKIEVLEPIRKELETISLTYCPSTPPEGVEGELLYLGDGTPENFEEKRDDIGGKIVLVTNRSPLELKRPLHRMEKYGRSVASGAKGFLYMNTQPGMLKLSGSLRSDAAGEIPGVSISYEDGFSLIQLKRKGRVRLRLYTNNRMEKMTSWNVLGDIPGVMYPDEMLIVCAHYDGHDISPNAVDNASGVAVMMELARVLSPFKGSFKRTIRFVSFSSEEIGMTGSRRYIQEHKEELKKVNLVINFDSIGVPGKKGYGVQGFTELIPYFKRFGEEINYSIPLTNEIHYISDHFSFVSRGVPAVWMLPESRIRLVEHRGFGLSTADTLDKVDPIEIKEAAILAAQAIIRIANEEKPVARHREEEEMVATLKQQEIDKVLTTLGAWELFFPSSAV